MAGKWRSHDLNLDHSNLRPTLEVPFTISCLLKREETTLDLHVLRVSVFVWPVYVCVSVPVSYWGNGDRKRWTEKQDQV